MNPASDAMADSPAAARAATSPTRPLYWSVRRELWENRSIFIAPMSVAGVVLFGFTMASVTLPARARAWSTLDAGHQQAKVAESYDAIAFLIVLTAFIVGVFYCLDALYGERRDRSILFWKSLPVSDLTTVLSKAAVPMVVLPALVFPLIVCAQFLVLLENSAVLAATGLNAGILWSNYQLVASSLGLLYGLVVIALWHAPIYGWLLLVSAWARRTAFLWALLPPLAIVILERITLNSGHFGAMLHYRLAGGIMQAFANGPPGAVRTNPLSRLTPGRFLAMPGLWLGLVFAAICLAAAARLRRYRSPL